MGMGWHELASRFAKFCHKSSDRGAGWRMVAAQFNKLCPSVRSDPAILRSSTSISTSLLLRDITNALAFTLAIYNLMLNLFQKSNRRSTIKVVDKCVPSPNLKTVARHIHVTHTSRGSFMSIADLWPSVNNVQYRVDTAFQCSCVQLWSYKWM